MTTNESDKKNVATENPDTTTEVTSDDPGAAHRFFGPAKPDADGRYPAVIDQIMEHMRDEDDDV